MGLTQHADPLHFAILMSADFLDILKKPCVFVDYCSCSKCSKKSNDAVASLPGFTAYNQEQSVLFIKLTFILENVTNIRFIIYDDTLSIKLHLSSQYNLRPHYI